MVQVKEDKPRKEVKKDWAETIKITKQIESISVELDVLINQMSSKYQEVDRLVRLAYQTAPLTDSGYGASPIGAGNIQHALKNHMRKKNVMIDGTYVGDVNKLPDFSQYVKDGLKWLLKFSTVGGVDVRS